MNSRAELAWADGLIEAELTRVTTLPKHALLRKYYVVVKCVCFDQRGENM